MPYVIYNRNMNALKRFSISIDDTLLDKFEAKITSRGYANRSQAIADLIRKALVNKEWSVLHGEVAGTITLVYNHHHGSIVNRLNASQHRYEKYILANTHVHLDEDNCLEVIVVKGKARKLKEMYNKTVRLKGIKYSDFSMATMGRYLT